MALLAMSNHRLRTFLTMLGIIIGIASVVSVVALGNGSQNRFSTVFHQWERAPLMLYLVQDLETGVQDELEP